MYVPDCENIRLKGSTSMTTWVDDEPSQTDDGSDVPCAGLHEGLLPNRGAALDASAMMDALPRRTWASSRCKSVEQAQRGLRSLLQNHLCL